MDPGSVYKSVVETDDKYVMPTYGRKPLLFTGGEGSVLIDVFGKRYIDCVSGIAVNATGYSNQKLISAIQEQAAQLIHISNYYYNIPQANVAEKLVQVTGLSKVFFCNSGAEANDGAMKLAKLHTKKNSFISTNNAFHGRTIGSLGATANIKYRDPFVPLVKPATFVEYGDAAAIEKAANGGDIAGVILEPIQGEGGVHISNKEYLKEVREICDKKDLVLIFDEVQTGFGRTGKWFCKDHYDVQPDILTMAKAIGGGLPMGAFAARDGLEFERGEHGTTFGGSPLVCAASLAVMETIEEQNLLENAANMGDYFIEKLSQMKRNDVVNVRGVGLMIGIELDHECGYFMDAAAEMGVLLNVTAGNVIRLLPPLTIQKEEVDRVVEVIDSVAKPN
ncbi:Acetylornithine aminotransferase [Methanimicrococcus stummii]|uniref:Acetylornithine aminotransferase n=1 Tax=Methanimicrococcus stummii TaxID=3028294 RepID=A0AA96V6Y4_9EURY|nr:aspartate aminotransferase family protein [Methanimicrococcus sp. Es2]WNY27867.1 Acetylornithine aminotransferase [Methanimicrococcus sp. Es2]